MRHQCGRLVAVEAVETGSGGALGVDGALYCVRRHGSILRLWSDGFPVNCLIVPVVTGDRRLACVRGPSLG